MRDERRRWMAVLARADAGALEAALSAEARPVWTVLRGPEVGMVMVRGRIGGGGGPFNLGEMTVTRCAVQTENGIVGHAYVAGRAPRHAELAAAADALMQDERWRATLEPVIASFAAAQQQARETVAAKAAATRVQFFTMRTMR
ncbi:MAG TPA: phosphonate C-P lyase system protein PhnG [Acetobacteraceae bacterium]|nr:phosphonate C-P lyase system protein PhnG [Acetobacteraceae bacterium]